MTEENIIKVSRKSASLSTFASETVAYLKGKEDKGIEDVKMYASFPFLSLVTEKTSNKNNLGKKMKIGNYYLSSSMREINPPLKIVILAIDGGYSLKWKERSKPVEQRTIEDYQVSQFVGGFLLDTGEMFIMNVKGLGNGQMYDFYKKVAMVRSQYKLNNTQKMPVWLLVCNLSSEDKTSPVDSTMNGLVLKLDIWSDPKTSAPFLVTSDLKEIKDLETRSDEMKVALTEFIDRFHLTNNEYKEWSQTGRCEKVIDGENSEVSSSGVSEPSTSVTMPEKDTGEVTQEQIESTPSTEEVNPDDVPF
jgi:hypothetical protein